MKKEFDVSDHFTSWEGWTCNYCGDVLPCDEEDLIEHLTLFHKIVLDD